MASKISLDNITIKNHQGNFMDPIDLQITFSNLAPLPYPTEWKIIYFGSALTEDYDQVLEQFQISPVEEVQTMKFQLSCQPPDFTKLPRSQLLSVTAMIITVSYKNQEFIRVGYYIHYQYVGQESQSMFRLPANEVVKLAKRTILFDKPRVTKFNIKWEKQQAQVRESQKELKAFINEQKKVEEQFTQKIINQQKQSTSEEKNQGFNNFSQSPQYSQCIG